ncbi:MFS transporter [Paenibacillus sp. GSMTC-2017]|uniref:MFS transporter n=1 Tax=Paenibacillus sp. GSMTC-2017 TaxID=2794350 RepID=UPI001E4C8635|nr:MFS transporter [Paenibacillus sp. GSMTC-2017]
MENATEEQGAEKLIIVLAGTLVISVMSATMFTIALPEIRAEFNLSFSQVSWITTSYLLTFAIGTMIYGKLADRYSLKSLLTFGLLFFALGSLIGLFAWDYSIVLLGRVIQAVGAGVIPALAGIIPVRYYPPERRGRALGIAMTGGAIGSAIGPAVAALIISVADWRWSYCFYYPTIVNM